MARVSAFDRTSDASTFRNACAYCRIRLQPGHHYDHVQPRSKGGPDLIANLVPVCPACNLAKLDTWTPVRDPYRGDLVQWFHPRVDQWEQHFFKRGEQVVGVTPSGRATCSVLFRPLTAPNVGSVDFSPGSLASDVALVELVIRLVAEQREGHYETSLRASEFLQPWTRSPHASDRWLADFSSNWLPAMARWKRGMPSDLSKSWKDSVIYYRRGRRDGEPAHGERFRLEWVATNAILLATLCDSRRENARADRYRRFAVNVYRRIALDPLVNDPKLRWRALSNQMFLEPSNVSGIEEVLEDIAEQSAVMSFQMAGDWSDAVIRTVELSSFSTLWSTWELIDELMQTSGYGAGGDLAEAVGLRRRWWLLQAALHMVVDLDLLSWDLDYWARNGLKNEIRLLIVDFRNLSFGPINDPLLFGKYI